MAAAKSIEHRLIRESMEPFVILLEICLISTVCHTLASAKHLPVSEGFSLSLLSGFFYNSRGASHSVKVELYKAVNKLYKLQTYVSG